MTETQNTQEEVQEAIKGTLQSNVPRDVLLYTSNIIREKMYKSSLFSVVDTDTIVGKKKPILYVRFNLMYPESVGPDILEKQYQIAQLEQKIQALDELQELSDEIPEVHGLSRKQMGTYSDLNLDIDKIRQEVYHKKMPFEQKAFAFLTRTAVEELGLRSSPVSLFNSDILRQEHDYVQAYCLNSKYLNFKEK